MIFTLAPLTDVILLLSKLLNSSIVKVLMLFKFWMLNVKFVAEAIFFKTSSPLEFVASEAQLLGIANSTLVAPLNFVASSD